MFRTALIATTALAIPTVASAAPRIDETPAVSAVSSGAARYCVVERRVDSLLTSRTCKSLDGWRAEGFDPRAKK